MGTGEPLVPVVPAAADGGGNSFLISVLTGSIWRWDHETEGAQLAAADFGSFLRLVVEDWLRFANDDRGWSYLV